MVSNPSFDMLQNIISLTFHAQDRFALNLGYDGLLTFNELMFDNY